MKIHLLIVVFVGLFLGSSAESESAEDGLIPSEPNLPDLCFLSPVKTVEDGPQLSCMGYFPMYTYNAKEGECQPYVYGGCLGTENLFGTKSECDRTCHGPQKVSATHTGGAGLSICQLDKDVGPCFGNLPRYFYNKATDRCEPFDWGGCRPNGNNFASADECVKSCGGGTPVFETRCEVKNCDWDKWKVYQYRGCTAKYSDGSCCPTSFQCSDIDTRTDGIIFETKDDVEPTTDCEYRNKTYKFGEEVPRDNPCKAGCRCSYDNEINCANVECPEMFNPRPPNSGCVSLYSEDSCCSTGEFCQQHAVAPPGQCFFDGKSFYHGQKIYPESEPCQICLCNPDFTDAFGPGCRALDCGFDLEYKDRIARGCTPVYFPNVCCPIDWICSDSELHKIEEVSGDLVKGDLPAHCLLNAEVGSCKAFKIKYYYDAATGSCKNFSYGGCRGNENNFDTIEQCEAQCPTQTKAASIDKLCAVEPDIGPCRGSTNRYFYNETTEKCEMFKYGGCKGNQNNFVNQLDCVATCVKRPAAAVVKKTPVETCSQPVKTGPCKAMKHRFFYNKETSSCEHFIYGGCQGNDNNFKDLDECKNMCENNVMTKKVEFADDICSLPKYPGPCSAGVPAFYFDASTRKCTFFTYGGCRGNENNFVTMEECEKNCGIWESNPQAATKSVMSQDIRTRVLEKIDICSLPAVQGPCRGAHRRYHYSPEEKKCVQFRYGGCKGNDNRFETPEECEEKCAPKKELGVVKSAVSVCELPPLTGPCRAYKPKYYFDKVDGLCKVFSYGGCRGNGNAFNSVSECMKSCGAVAMRRAGPTLQCKMGSKTFKLGEKVNTNNDCVTCECATPPDLTCVQQKCPDIPDGCTWEYHDGQCCPEIKCEDLRPQCSMPHCPGCKIIEGDFGCPACDCSELESGSSERLEDPCIDHICPEGETCYVKSNKMICPRGQCAPVPGCRPVTGLDIDPCSSIDCAMGEECYLKEPRIACVKEACPKAQPACRKLDCSRMRCGTDETCYLREVCPAGTDRSKCVKLPACGSQSPRDPSAPIVTFSAAGTIIDYCPELECGPHPLRTCEKFTPPGEPCPVCKCREP